MSDDDIIASGSLLKAALAFAQEDVVRLTRERGKALLIHQTDTGTESAVAALQDKNERLR